MQQTEFLLDVFERFGKSDAQAALDFVRRNRPLLEFDEEKAAQFKTEDGRVIYVEKEQEGPIQLVDLGLPSGTLWADRNLGAKSPEEYGAFVSWGNTDLHFPDEEKIDWGDDNEAFDYKFNSDEYKKTPGYKLEGDIDAEHDAATVNLGEPFRMPTSEEFQELYDNCDWTRKTIKGVNGYLVTSKINGNSIFLPCAGYGHGQSWYNRGSNGDYWSASLYSQAYGRYLLFHHGGVGPQVNDNRFYGFAVRPVQTSFSQSK